MSLIGAFSNGVAGLMASSEAIGTVSQNISNLRTPGYRRVETEFETLLGGIDTRGHEPGGVRATTRRFVEIQGAIETSSRQFDLAISGAGFFVFSTDPSGSTDEVRYSRAGNLGTVPLPETPDVGYLANQQGLLLLGWSAVDGQFPDDIGSLKPIPATSVEAFEGQATTTASIEALLPASENTAAMQIFYFNAAGDQQTVDLDWTKTGPNTWSLQPTDRAGTPLGGPTTVTFDGTGVLTSASTVNIGGLFDLDISGLGQRGTATLVGNYEQNGIARGEFVHYNIDDTGTIYGHYSSGAVRSLYRIPIANFTNPNALAEEPGNLYRETAESGSVTLLKAGGDTLKVVSGAIELANFDLSDGFAKMIIAQRAYDTAAQVVRTVDEMAQLVRDLKR
jgi:flagellar hook protein FlgE